jgi:hypothetical protein
LTVVQAVVEVEPQTQAEALLEGQVLSDKETTVVPVRLQAYRLEVAVAVVRRLLVRRQRTRLRVAVLAVQV